MSTSLRNNNKLAFLFPDWQSAEQDLIQEPDEHRRWWHFRFWNGALPPPGQ